MNTKKVKITIIVIAIILSTLLGVFAFKILPEHDREYYLTHPDYFCIAVDSYENIYIGTIGQIRVINNKGEIIRDIPIDSLKGFMFNIIDDRIYMHTVPGDYVTDLYGNKLDIPLTDEENRRIQTRSVSRFNTEDGTEYFLNNNCVFRTKNGKTEQIYPITNQSGGHKSLSTENNKEGNK